MDHFAARQEAERTIRAWHAAALKMRDAAIEKNWEEVERIYFDAAMFLPFYGADADPLPSEGLRALGQTSPAREVSPEQ